MKIIFGALFAISSINAAFATVVPAPEIGESYIGMAAVAGMVYLVRRMRKM